MANKKNITLSSQEVIEILGINSDKLKYWKRIKSGKQLPSVKFGKFAKFDPVALYQWLEGKKYSDLALKLKRWIDNTGAEKTKEKIETASKTDKHDNKSDIPPGSFSFDFSFDEDNPIDIFEVKKMMGQLLKDLVNNLNGADYAVVGVLTKNLNALAEGFRKLESSCIEIDEQLGNVVPIADVRKYHGEIMTRVKTDLRALPYAVADELVGMESPEKISEVLKKRIDDSLRHLSEVITANGITSE